MGAKTGKPIGSMVGKDPDMQNRMKHIRITNTTLDCHVSHAWPAGRITQTLDQMR